jgi:hypothetical protein
MNACRVCGCFEPFQGLTDECCLNKTNKDCIFGTPPLPGFQALRRQLTQEHRRAAPRERSSADGLACSLAWRAHHHVLRERSSADGLASAASSSSQGLAEGNQLRGSAEGTQLRCSAEQPVAQSNVRSRSRSRQIAGPITDGEDMQTSWELHQQRRSRWRELRKGGGRGRSAQQLASSPMNDPEADRDDPHASN